MTNSRIIPDGQLRSLTHNIDKETTREEPSPTMTKGKQAGKEQRGRKVSGWSLLTAEEREEVRRRVAGEIAASAFLGEGRLALEVLYLLPAAFTTQYSLLFFEALKDETASTAGAKGKPEMVDTLMMKEWVEVDWDNLGQKEMDELDEAGIEVIEGKGKNKGTHGYWKEHWEKQEVHEGPLTPKLRKDSGANRGRNMASGGGKRHKLHWTVKSEEAFAKKDAVDKKLKGLASEIESFLKDPKGSTAGRRCRGAGCQKFMDHSWRFCPSCGKDSRPSQKGKALPQASEGQAG